MTWPNAANITDTTPQEDFITTLRAAWKDGPDTLQRMKEELDRVDFHARALEKRIGKFCPSEDLRAFGREGLLDAARSYNENRGVPFSAWASLRVRNAMIDGVRRWGSVPRSVLRELKTLANEQSNHPADSERTSSELRVGHISVAPNVMERTVADRKRSPEEMAAAGELRTMLANSISTLPEAQQSLVRRYYGEDQTLEEAAQALGCQKSWASKLLARALTAMRQDLDGRNTEERRDQVASSRRSSPEVSSTPSS